MTDSRPYQNLIELSREQIVKSRAWSQECFDEYMEILAKPCGPLAIHQTARQSRLNIIMTGMKIANSWVDYWISTEKNYTNMQRIMERIERLTNRTPRVH